MEPEIKGYSVQKKIEALQQMIHQTSAYWQGDAAQEYRAVMEMCLQDIMRILEDEHGATK